MKYKSKKIIKKFKKYLKSRKIVYVNVTINGKVVQLPKGIVTYKQLIKIMNLNPNENYTVAYVRKDGFSHVVMPNGNVLSSDGMIVNIALTNNS